MKALVCSGGDLRFFWHLGALDVLAEQGWRPDIAFGTSAGALIVTALMDALNKGHDMKGAVARLHALTEDVTEPSALVNQSPFKLWRYIQGLRGKGMLTLDPLLARLRDAVGDGEVAHARVAIGDLCSGTVRSWPANAKAAVVSSAVPFVAPHLGGLVDGGVLLNAPLKPAIDAGATEIVILITKPYKLPNVPTKALGSGLAVLGRSLEVMTHRMIHADVKLCLQRNEDALVEGGWRYRQIRLQTVWANSIQQQRFAKASISSFSLADVHALTDAGREDARTQIWVTDPAVGAEVLS